MYVCGNGEVLACGGTSEFVGFHDVLVHDAAGGLAFEEARWLCGSGSGLWGRVSCSYQEVTEGWASFVGYNGGFRENGF